MLANISTMLSFYEANHSDIVTGVVIMTSMIIFAIGLLKPIIFNKITNKHARKAALSFSNVAASYLAALVFFLVKGWSFQHYFVAGFALSVACIMTYWVYENTCLRNLINLIGEIALRKLLSVLSVALTADDVKAVKKELENVATELKGTTKAELKKAVNKVKEDKDLKNI